MSSYSHQKGLTWVHILFAIVLIVVILIALIPLVMRSHGTGHHRTEALNNAKALAGGLICFKEDYGHYPCDRTRRTLEEDSTYFSNDGVKIVLPTPDSLSAPLPPGKSANAYLAQLIVTDIIDSESYFYASGVKGSIKGDDMKSTPDKILAPGENSFAYVMAPNGKPLTNVQPDTPLVMAIVKSGGPNPIFDSRIYSGKCLYGAADGSGKISPLSITGHALLEEGVPLFDTGPGTLFETETPVVVTPLIK